MRVGDGSGVGAGGSGVLVAGGGVGRVTLGGVVTTAAGSTGPAADTTIAGEMGSDLATRKLNTPPQIKILISTRTSMIAHCL